MEETQAASITINRERHLINIVRLLTKELSLYQNPKNPRQAFEIQSRLMKDTLVE